MKEINSHTGTGIDEKDTTTHTEITSAVNHYLASIEKVVDLCDFVDISNDELTKERYEIGYKIPQISNTLCQEYLGLIPLKEEETMDFEKDGDRGIINDLRKDEIAGPRIELIPDCIDPLEKKLLIHFFRRTIEISMLVFEQAVLVENELEEKDRVSFYDLWESIRVNGSFLVKQAKDLIELRNKMGQRLTEEHGRIMILNYYQDYLRDQAKDMDMLLGATALYQHARGDLMELAMDPYKTEEETVIFFMEFMNAAICSSSLVLKNCLLPLDNFNNYHIGNPLDMIFKALRAITFIAKKAHFIVYVLEKE